MSRLAWRRSIARAGGILVVGVALVLPTGLRAENCITQSQMTASDRDALTAAAQSFAAKAQANDAAGIKAATMPEYFDGIAAAIGGTAPKIAGDALSITSLYILEVSAAPVDPSAASGFVAGDRQFFCSLNNSAADVELTFPVMLPDRYALAIVHAQGSNTAWQLSFVLEQSGGAWKLAGFYSRPAMAAGHDGVWYWAQARQFAKQSQNWSAWLYYTEADALLTPVEFISSTNRDKLHAEQTAVTPTPLQANGISPAHPLNVGGFAFTAIGTQESLDGKSLELAVHLAATDVSNPTDVRARSLQALHALLITYPELHTTFAGAWVYSDAPGQSPFGIEFNPISTAIPPEQNSMTGMLQPVRGMAIFAAFKTPSTALPWIQEPGS